MAVDDETTNTYEEARKQRLEENKKRFQELGILSISQSLKELAHSEKKSKTQQRLPKPKSENPFGLAEPRRSTRERKTVVSYHDNLDIEPPQSKKRPRKNSSWTSYISRPMEEVRLASIEERRHALAVAEKFQSTLQSGNPSFVKSMVRSHVYSCFWLGLPSQFCKDHLPKGDLDMTLEDEKGVEYEAKYIGRRAGLSGGWRLFALDHKLDDGDATVFELVEPDRFKVYAFRVTEKEANSEKIEASEGAERESINEAKSKSKRAMKMTRQIDQNGNDNVQKPQQVVTDAETAADDAEVDATSRSKRRLAKAKSSSQQPAKSVPAKEPAGMPLRRSSRRK